MAEHTSNSIIWWKQIQGEIQKRLSRPKRGAVIGIDVDGHVLRVVQTTPRGGGNAITQMATAPLDLRSNEERTDPSALGKAIASALTRLQIRPSSVVMGVPRASVILRKLFVPLAGDVRELASMVHFQIGKDLPIRPEDAVIDFKVRRQIAPPSSTEAAGKSPESSDSAPKAEVLVAAVRRDIVEFFQKTAAAAGLRLVALGWLSDANAHCAEACGLTDDDGCVGLVSLRLDEVSIDVIEGRSLVFSRGVALRPVTEAIPSMAASADGGVSSDGRGSEASLPEPESAVESESFVETAIIEVVRSIHSYGGTESSIPLTRLFVAGATGHELALVSALKQRLNIQCDLMDPAQALGLPETTRKEAAGSVSALGLALGVNDPQGLSIDFLNPKKPAVQRNMRRIRTMSAAAAAALLLFSVLGVRAHLINQRLRLNREILAELTEAEKKRPIYKQMRQQATTVQDWVKQGRDCLEHYLYLTSVLPGSEEIYVSSLMISGQGSIRFAVQARSGEVLAKLDKQLRAAGYDIKPLAINPGTDKFGYNFRSTVELTAPDKMKLDVVKAEPPARPADDSAPTLAKRKGGTP